MSDKLSNNKRIVKNTMALYVRMLFVMIVSLYSSRVILDILGELDYGIYNLVGGIVVMFSFLSTIFSSASQRYFAFDLGRGDGARLNKVFNITAILYISVVVLLFVLSETFGLWFLHNKLTIPDDRMFAANWVFQFSIISFCVTVLATPYQSVIIAHEKMNVYAFVGVLEAILTMVCVYALKYSTFGVDNLILYGILVLGKVIICQFFYFIYAYSKFIETHITWVWDKFLAYEMIAYSWWNIFGGMASVCRDQGINLLIGMFFNPAINAARGLANGISGSLNVFSTNFFTAVRPQITKYYAKNDTDSTLSLVFKSSKFSYFLLAFIAIPMMAFIEVILDIWLVDVPEYTALFAKLVIITALIDSLNLPLMTLMQATGHVKLYQLLTGGLIFCNIPLSYIFLELGFGPEYTMYVAIFIALCCMISRLFVCKRYIVFPIKKYCLEVLTKAIIVSFVIYVTAILVYNTVLFVNRNVLLLCACLILCIALSVVEIYLLGLSATEKETAISFVKSKINKQ